MEVEAARWTWTQDDMKSSPWGEYVLTREVERLLATVFEAGRQRGLQQAVDVLNKAPT